MKFIKLIDKGIAEYKKNNFKKSINYFKDAINISEYQYHATLHYNLGLCYYSLMQYYDALFHFQLSSDYGRYSSNWEVCLSKLQLNDLSGIFLYNYRPDKEQILSKNIPIPEIKNIEEIEQCKNLLVLNEQGFGDEILFSRGLELIKNINFSYQVYPENIDLFKSLWNGNFFSKRVLEYDFIKQHDKFILSGDLFMYYTITKGTKPVFPAIIKDVDSKGVGFCYESNRLSPNTNLRSISLKTIKQILNGKTDLISLQKDSNLDFAECPTLNNFFDTFNIIQNLKEVITIDTSVAHLAALCNIRTYVLYNEYLDWRWKINFYGNHVTPVKVSNFEYLK